MALATGIGVALLSGMTGSAIMEYSVDINKNKYNEKLDIRLMKLLNLKFDEIYEFKNIIELFNSEVSLKLINLAWYSSNQEDNIIRYKLTKKGIENFLSKY